MKRTKTNYKATVEDGQSSTELLILPDGRVLAHNISPAMAAVLARLDPGNADMSHRAKVFYQKKSHEAETGN